MFGMLNAMYQVRLKRFLAYSAIANVGFILVGFSAFNVESILASLFYIICYIIPVIAVFCVITNIRVQNLGKELSKLFELPSISNNSFVFKLLMISLIFFSFAGIPPLIGFFAKFILFLGLFNGNNFFIVCILFLISLVSAFYYIRVVRYIFFIKEPQVVQFYNYELNIMFIIVTYINFFLIFYFDDLYNLLYNIWLSLIY